MDSRIGHTTTWLHVIAYLLDRIKEKEIAVFVKNNVNWPQVIQEYPIFGNKVIQRISC